MESELLRCIAGGDNPAMVTALLRICSPDTAEKAYSAACLAHDSASTDQRRAMAKFMLDAVMAALPDPVLHGLMPALEQPYAEPPAAAAAAAVPAPASKNHIREEVDLCGTTDESASEEEFSDNDDCASDSDDSTAAAARSRKRRRQRQRKRYKDMQGRRSNNRGCRLHTASAGQIAKQEDITSSSDNDSDCSESNESVNHHPTVRRRPACPGALRLRRGRARGGVAQPPQAPQPLNLLDFQLPHYQQVCDILRRTSRFFDPSLMGAGKTYILLKYCLDHDLPLVYTGPSAMRSKIRKLCRVFGIKLQDFLSWNKVRGQQGRVTHNWLHRTDTEHSYTNAQGEECTYTTTAYVPTQALLDLVQRGAVFAFDECQHGKNDGNQNEAAATIAASVYGSDHVGDGTVERVTPSSVFLLSATPIDKPEQAYTFARMLGLLRARAKKRLYTTADDQVLVEDEGIWPFVQWCRGVNPALTETLLKKLNDLNDDNAIDEWNDDDDANEDNHIGPISKQEEPAIKRQRLEHCDSVCKDEWSALRIPKMEPPYHAAAAAASASASAAPPPPPASMALPGPAAASQQLACRRLRELMADDKQHRPIRRFNRFVLRLVSKIALTQLSHAMSCDFGIRKDIKSAYYQFASAEDLKLYNDGVSLLEQAFKFSEDDNAGDSVSSEPNWKDMTEALQRIERAKVGILIRLARIYLLKHPNNKVVLFVNFHHSLDQLEAELREFSPLRLDGKVPEHKRSERVEAFQAHDTTHRLLISTMRVGGVGIDLHDTHGDFPRFAFVVPDFHIQNCHQAPGRFVRAGGKSDAFIRFVFGLPWLEDDADGTRHMERIEYRIWRALCLKSNVLKQMARQQCKDGVQFAIDYAEIRETHRTTAATMDIDLSVMLPIPAAAAAAAAAAPAQRVAVASSLPVSLESLGIRRVFDAPPVGHGFIPFSGRGYSLSPVVPPPARAVQTHAIPGRPHASLRERFLHHAQQQARQAATTSNRKRKLR